MGSFSSVMNNDSFSSHDDVCNTSSNNNKQSNSSKRLNHKLKKANSDSSFSSCSYSSTSSISKQIDEYIDDKVFHPPEFFPEDLIDPTSYNIEFIKTTNDKETSFISIKNEQNEDKKCMIYSHGNAESILQFGSTFFDVSEKFCIDVFCYDYQGYGFSKDKCSEQNCYDDLEAMVNHVLSLGYVKKNIFLVGRSLGSGIVIDYVSKDQEWTTPVILISPYKSIVKVVCDNFIGGMINKFHSESKAKNVKCPVKIFHGENDDVINCSHGKKLAKLFENNNKGKYQITLIPNGTHGIDIWSKKYVEYTDDLKEVFNYNT